MRATLVTLGALLAVACSASKTDIKESIPNWSEVPELVEIVSNPNRDVSKTNSFIDALQRTDYTWTLELCKADSDGDGQSNGYELGDPCCSWVQTRNLFSHDCSNPGDASSKTNPNMYEAIQCTQSEEAIEARDRHKKTLKPKTTRPPRKPRGDSSGSGKYSGTIRKASTQQDQDIQKTSSAAIALVSSTVVTVLTVAWVLL